MKKRRSFLRRASRSKTDAESETSAPAATTEDDMSEVTTDANEPDDSLSRSAVPSHHPLNDNYDENEPTQVILATEPDHHVLDTRFVAVNYACEEIWKCQEPQQAASWLELLHHALLRTTLDSYLPSEVFVCISGAALRFHHEQQETHDVDVLWTVWEEAMWAAAALARVCVGAAWRHQLRQRREWGKHKKQGLDDDSPVLSDSSKSSPKIRVKPLDVVSTDLASDRSYSPMMSSSLEALNRSDKPYPLIPENLPAAMLRFAAIETFLPQLDAIKDRREQQKWLDRRKSLAEAQRELVLALCYVLPEEQTDNPDLVANRLEWTILEAHEPVASMVRSWLESASMTWYLPSSDNDDDDLSDSKPAAKASDDSEATYGSSKSTQSMRNTTDAVADDDLSEHQELVQRENLRERQRRELYRRVSSGALDFTEIDWWSTLQVVRAAFQLVSAGWRISQDETGEEIIAYFLGIVENGMLLRADELQSHGTESDHVAREERLAASSSAMTAISILSAVASVGLIPANMQFITTKTISRVQLRAADSNVCVAALFPGGDHLRAEEQEEWKTDYDTFLEQRDDCISDVVALYWVLLAHSSSAAAVMAAFSEMMSLNHSDGFVGDETADKPFEQSVAHRTLALQSACVATDAVSGALWGKPPDMPGVAHLRIYWFQVLVALRNIASCTHEWIVEIDVRWNDTAGNAIENSKFVHSALLLLLEVVVSLKRFVDEEMLRGEGLLAPDEWEVLVEILDENIDKWLRMTDKTWAFADETTSLGDIQSALSVLLGGLHEFFDQCTHSETSPFNLVVDDECRVKLYSVMLQKAVPYMPPQKGTSLALAVLRSWAATGFAIHRSDGWARTASYIITDVFSMFEVQAFGLYQGYVHSPSVRLEALKLIALGEEDEQRPLNPEQFEPSQETSPLEQSLHLREQYLALVNGSLLPPLMTLFGVQASNIHVAVVLPLPTASFSAQQIPIGDELCGGPATHTSEELSIEIDDHALRRFAAKLLGRLYRSGTGEKWHRSSLLKMLLSAAINNSLDEFSLSNRPDATGHVVPEDLFTGESHTSLQAIQELEKCLSLPFGWLPNAHESLPPVVDALCSVLIVYGGEPLKERHETNVAWLAMKRCLAISSVLPLSRLGITHDKRLVLSRHRDISGLVPSQIVQRLVTEYHTQTLSVRHEHHEGDLSSEIAPFVIVSDDPRYGGPRPLPQTSRPSSERTQLSFISVFSSLLATLHTNLESKRVRDKTQSGKVSEGMDCQPIEILDSNFRALCYDALGGFVRSGVEFPFTKELIPILQVQVGCVASAEASARCRCAASVAEALVVKFKAAEDSLGGCLDDTDALLRHLLNFCRSGERSTVLIGCQSLRGLVSFIAKNSSTYGLLVFDALSGRLRKELENLRVRIAGGEHSNVEKDYVAESLVTLLYDIICASAEQDRIFLTSEMLLQTFDSCWDLCAQSDSMPHTGVCRVLCVRLVSVLLNRLNIEDATTETKTRTRFRDLVGTMPPDYEEPPAVLRHDEESSACAILDDLVAQKILTAQDLVGTSDEPINLSYHESMAEETDNINRFAVQGTNTDKEVPFAAWLCGKSTLLTCRLGSLNSRYRGWLELVIRSPTCRKRRLVRLPSMNSLDCPELPSSLWNGPSSQPDPASLTEDASDYLARRFVEPSSEMKKAALVMKRFDEVFGQPNKNTVPFLSASSGEAGRDIGSTGQSQRKASNSSVVARDFNETACSIEGWLRRVLNDSAAVHRVVDELCALGIGPPILSAAMSAKKVDILSCRFLPVDRLSFSPRLRRAISILDRLPPFDTHKIALLLATDALADETVSSETALEGMLLSSAAGSPKFLSFTEGLGKLVLTRHLKYYSGGLDTSGLDSDGKLSVIWLDRNDSFARRMVVFHVVPLMPEGSNNRKRHVGNDNVHIVFVEPGCMLDHILRRGQAHGVLTSNMVSGEFGFVVVFVQTLAGEGVMRVSIRLRDGLADNTRSRLDHLVGEHIVSEAAAPSFVRQLATRADVSCRAIMEQHLGQPNWEERQSQIASMQRHRLHRIDRNS